MTTWQHAPQLLTLPNGTALTSGQTTDPAAGTVLTGSTSQPGGVTTFENGRWHHVGNPGVARLDLTIPNTARVATRYDFVITGLPIGDDARILEIGTVAGQALRISQRASDGHIAYLNAAGTAVADLGVLAAGNYSVFAAIEPGTTTTNGKVRINLYAGHGSTTPLPGSTVTPIAGFTYASDTANARTATTVTYVRYGRLSSLTGSSYTIDTAGIQANDVALTPIGALTIAGQGSAGLDQANKEPGDTVVLEGTGTGTWTQTAGTPTVALTTVNATTSTFEFPATLEGATLTFSYGGDTMTVTGNRATRFLATTGGKVPVRRRLITVADVGVKEPVPVDTELLAVTNLRGFQVLPGTRHSRLEWGDPNIDPPAVKYLVSEANGGLNTTVTTRFRESTDLAPGNYVYTVSPIAADGATGPGVSVPITIVDASAAPTVTQTAAPTIGTRTWSVPQTATPAVTALGQVKVTVDGPVVATFLLTTPQTNFTESYSGLEPGGRYIRTFTATDPVTGAATTQSGTFTTQQATATLKYERLGPVLANDTDPLPAGFSDWTKYRILSQTTYNVNDGPTLGYNGGKITFPAGSNNLVFFPRSLALAKQGGLTLQGGHHLAIYGGEINHATVFTQDQYLNKTTTQYGQSQRVSFQPNQQTGDVYIEGMWIHGAQINDPVWLNLAPTTITGRKRTVTFQNCWFADANAPSLAALKGPDYQAPGTNPATGAAWLPGQDPATGVVWTNPIELHPDGIQLLSDGTNTVIRLYQVQIDSGYQGIMDNMGDGVELEMERVHLNLCYPLKDGTTAWEQRNGYPFFFGGPVRVVAGTVVVREPPRKIGTAQRQPGYPETASKWVGITQIVTETPADPSWRAAAWSGLQVPGRAYKAA